MVTLTSVEATPPHIISTQVDTLGHDKPAQPQL